MIGGFLMLKNEDKIFLIHLKVFSIYYTEYILWRWIMSDKLGTLIESAKGAIGEILLEEAAPVLISEMLKGTVIEAATSMAGVAVPGVGNMLLSYKQKKMERNVEICISKIVENQDEINKRLDRLEEEKLKNIQSRYFGLVTDYAAQTKQEEKIEFIVNGFINITGDILSQEDKILMYYDVLDQLSMLDIRVLRFYVQFSYVGIGGDDNISDIMKDYDLDFSQMAMIKEKLERLGLLESRNDRDMDENIRNMAQYIEDVARGKKNPKLKRLKKISKSESYKLTPYGRSLYLFFSEIIEKVD